MIHAIVPVKGLASSKSRLLPHLGRESVEKLAIAMLGDIVGSLRAVSALEEIAVVTPDARVAKAAEEAGALPLLRLYPDLNTALDGSAKELARTPEDAALVVLGDVAAVQPADLEILIRSLDGMERPAAVLAPSRDGGTSALLRSPWNSIDACFGPGSAAVHRARAEATGVAFAEMELASLAIDIDTPEDIEEALERVENLGARTRAGLESLA
jgi:2-phospho-L-lactate guanylyltransferase